MTYFTGIAGIRRPPLNSWRTCTLVDDVTDNGLHGQGTWALFFSTQFDLVPVASKHKGSRGDEHGGGICDRKKIERAFSKALLPSHTFFRKCGGIKALPRLQCSPKCRVSIDRCARQVAQRGGFPPCSLTPPPDP